METRGCAHRVECSRTGSRRRFRSRCRRAWWPSARREDVRRPCRARSRPCYTCHARGRHRDPAADSPKGKPTRVEHVQAIRLEAAAAPQARPEAGKCASALVHPWPRAVLHARSTSASPACDAGGSRITCRGVRKGIRKVEGAHACAGDGRRGFDRHCADRLLTADEEVAKKSGAGRRKKIAQAQLLVDQICGLGDHLYRVPARAWQIRKKIYGCCTCYVMTHCGCAPAREREGLGKAVRGARPQDSQGGRSRL